MKLRITRRAATFVESRRKWAEPQTGPGYVPVIQLVVVDETEQNPDGIETLILGLEKADVVIRSRVMECDGEKVEIFLYAPDELLGEDGRKSIDVSNGTLVVAEE
jgi:hypothetical protein